MRPHPPHPRPDLRPSYRVLRSCQRDMAASGSVSDGAPSVPPGLPVAKVVVDVNLPHLDRPFDYSVPDELAQTAQPGSRVRVRFSGRLVDGFVVERCASSEHRLAPLQRVISPLPVLTPDILALCQAVADRYAGTLADVVRFAVPPRHARAEKLVLQSPPGVIAHSPDFDTPTEWTAYTGGEGLLDRLRQGERVRAVWTVAPGDDPYARIVDLTRAAMRNGGVIIVVPDATEVRRVDVALRAGTLERPHEVMTADQGPQARYSAFVRLLTGRSNIVVGTRSTAFAPVSDPALLLCWDDGDESLAEQHSPGWNAREVLALRSTLSDQSEAPGTSLITAGWTRTVETQSWVESRWAVGITPRRDHLRSHAPRIQPESSDRVDDRSRIPARAFPVVRSALAHGPVLVQVARRGYVPGLACQQCRTSASCGTCGGPLRLPHESSPPVCDWCHVQVVHFACSNCGGTRLRATAVGSARTAEEWGRAFPDVPVIMSAGESVREDVTAEPAIVIATPGVEPRAVGGYAAVLLLDAAAMAARSYLRGNEETLRRWFSAAALAQPTAPVVITAPQDLAIVQALIRWDPVWFASRELVERRELRLPPTVRSATITTDYSAAEVAADYLRERADDQWRIIGPLSLDAQRGRVLVTVPRRLGARLVAVLREISAARSTRREREHLEIRVDPYSWGS
jgi:primosomal protein N' (replication factor Y) (superfamily II helicase)